MRKLVFAAVFALSFCFSGSLYAAEHCDDDEVVIKFSHVVAAEGHPKGEMASALARRINVEMDGKACMQVFPSAQLFDDDKVMEALLLGDVQLAAPSLSKFEAYTLKYRVFDLPFLFSSMAAVKSFTEGDAGQELLGAMSDYGFVGLGYIFNGLKQFSANRPLRLPRDAADLDFRVQNSDVTVAMIEALGANARKIRFSDVYNALESGRVGGQENTWSNIFAENFHTVQDGVTETNHQLLAYLAVVSRDWLDSLQPNVRHQFLKIFGEVSNEFNARALGINALKKLQIIENGGVVRQLTPEQRDKWVEVMKPVWDQFIDDIGQDVIEAALEASRSQRRTGLH